MVDVGWNARRASITIGRRRRGDGHLAISQSKAVEERGRDAPRSARAAGYAPAGLSDTLNATGIAWGCVFVRVCEGRITPSRRPRWTAASARRELSAGRGVNEGRTNARRNREGLKAVAVGGRREDMDAHLKLSPGPCMRSGTDIHRADTCARRVRPCKGPGPRVSVRR